MRADLNGARILGAPSENENIDGRLASIVSETVTDRPDSTEFETASLTCKGYTLLERVAPKFRTEVDNGISQPQSWMEQDKVWIFRTCFGVMRIISVLSVFNCSFCDACKPRRWKCKPGRKANTS